MHRFAVCEGCTHGERCDDLRACIKELAPGDIPVTPKQAATWMKTIASDKLPPRSVVIDPKPVDPKKYAKFAVPGEEYPRVRTPLFQHNDVCYKITVGIVEWQGLTWEAHADGTMTPYPPLPNKIIRTPIKSVDGLSFSDAMAYPDRGTREEQDAFMAKHRGYKLAAGPVESVSEVRVNGESVYRVPTREEFEAWITKRGVFSVARKSNGQYVNPYVRGAWAMRCAIITEFKS